MKHAMAVCASCCHPPECIFLVTLYHSSGFARVHCMCSTTVATCGSQLRTVSLGTDEKWQHVLVLFGLAAWGWAIQMQYWTHPYSPTMSCMLLIHVYVIKQQSFHLLFMQQNFVVLLTSRNAPSLPMCIVLNN